MVGKECAWRVRVSQKRDTFVSGDRNKISESKKTFQVPVRLFDFGIDLRHHL